MILLHQGGASFGGNRPMRRNSWVAWPFPSLSWLLHSNPVAHLIIPAKPPRPLLSAALEISLPYSWRPIHLHEHRYRSIGTNLLHLLLKMVLASLYDFGPFSATSVIAELTTQQFNTCHPNSNYNTPNSITEIGYNTINYTCIHLLHQDTR